MISNANKCIGKNKSCPRTIMVIDKPTIQPINDQIDRLNQDTYEQQIHQSATDNTRRPRISSKYQHSITACDFARRAVASRGASTQSPTPRERPGYRPFVATLSNLFHMFFATAQHTVFVRFFYHTETDNCCVCEKNQKKFKVYRDCRF